jgi:hypothetical protein
LLLGSAGNLCFHRVFLSAKLVRDRGWWSSSDKWVAFRQRQETHFGLAVDKLGAKAAPDFGKRAKMTRPSYRLAAGSNNGRAILKVVIENNEIDQEILSKILKETYPVVWSRRYPVHTFHIADDIYAVISVEVVAKRTDDNTVVVESAELTSPEYRLLCTDAIHAAKFVGCQPAGQTNTLAKYIHWIFPARKRVEHYPSIQINARPVSPCSVHPTSPLD